MSPTSARVAALDATLAEAARHRAAGQPAAALATLERAHVLGQCNFGPHLRVHLRMLAAAWALRDGRELRGQLLRIVLTPIGHLSGRLPKGNPGTARVSAFALMPLAPDLAQLLNAGDT